MDSQPVGGAGQKTAAIVVNWNSSDDTVRVARHLLALWPKLHVFVVDNGSTAEQIETLSSLSDPRVTVVLRQQNGGYAAGVNEGLRRAHADDRSWAWLINPDSLPLMGCLEELLRFAGHALAVAPRQTTSDRPEVPGMTYPSAARVTGSRVRPFVCEGCAEGVHAVDVVTGTGLLLDTRSAVEAGGMNEGFFHYKEEFELIERLGWVGPVRLACRASVWHQRGASLDHQSATASYYRTRNELLYLRIRHRRTWWAQPRLWRFVARQIASSLTTSAPVRSAQLAGVRDGLLGRTGMRAA